MKTTRTTLFPAAKNAAMTRATDPTRSTRLLTPTQRVAVREKLAATGLRLATANEAGEFALVAPGLSVWATRA